MSSDKIFHLPSIFLDFKPIPKEMLNIWMKCFLGFSVSRWLSFPLKTLQNKEEKKQKLHIKSVSGRRKDK
jgi:hypothetical protein